MIYVEKKCSRQDAYTFQKIEGKSASGIKPQNRLSSIWIFSFFVHIEPEFIEIRIKTNNNKNMKWKQKRKHHEHTLHKYVNNFFLVHTSSCDVRDVERVVSMFLINLIWTCRGENKKRACIFPYKFSHVIWIEKKTEKSSNIRLWFANRCLFVCLFVYLWFFPLSTMGLVYQCAPCHLRFL